MPYSEEPIVIDNDEALNRLAPLADAFLLHDREIYARCDDSVVRIFEGRELPIRRSRGYAPFPVRLPFSAPPLLAVGAELKNTFCLTREEYAFLSQHIGDMENYETLSFFRQMVEQLTRTFRVRPERIACDMHPAYLATRYARERAASGGIPLEMVQHHHAHVAAAMAENGLPPDATVIGVALDGTGFGLDGAIWGGEFLIADYRSFRRLAHLRYFPLPGGDAAIRRPYRVALAYLWEAGIPWEGDLPPVGAASELERAVLRRQLERGLGTVATSSMGRLFDAVAALAGVRQEVTYEAQAAMELEGLVDPEEEESYPFTLDDRGDGPWVIDPRPMLQAVVADVRAGLPAGRIAARFHNGVAQAIALVCERARSVYGVDQAVLSGGVFQNVTLLGKVLRRLVGAGLTVWTHHRVPPNDGGLALGQAAVAAARWQSAAD